MIRNKDVPNIAASAAVYRIENIDSISPVFTFNSDDPALGYSGEGLVKKDFQSVHKGEASDDLTNYFLAVYGLTLDSFKSRLRTVGVGTNILIRDGVGTNGDVHIPMVGRTDTGPNGTVALGKQSRAAGGADGCLMASGYRELQEEFICAHDKNGNLTIFNLDYDEDGLDTTIKDKILQTKQNDIQRILQTYNLDFSNIIFAPLKGQILNIPHLTSDITQDMDGSRSTIKNRVLTDNPTAGDFAGVDTIVHVQLPEGMTSSQLIIRDGEANFEGDLLKRQWSLATAEQWIQQVKEGMPISPAPKKVFDNWDKVAPVLRAL